jgi:hypothetical protein
MQVMMQVELQSQVRPNTLRTIQCNPPRAGEKSTTVPDTDVLLFYGRSGLLLGPAWVLCKYVLAGIRLCLLALQCR